MKLTSVLSSTQRLVFDIGTDGKAKARPVETGAQYGDRTVIEEGLEPGTSVITSHLHRLRDGRPITVAAKQKRG